MALRDCTLDIQPGRGGVSIPGFTEQLPQGAFVRGVPGGTLQQVILRLDILHALQFLNVHVYNNGRAIERTVDKAMTSFLLHGMNIPTPKTWICESREHAYSITQRETMAGRPLVLKPLFGSQGIGVRKLEGAHTFPVPMEQHIDGVYYLQSYINSGSEAWHDYRVFVINHQVAAAMVRYGNSWINNVAQGGRCEPIAPDSDITRLALAAARAVDVDYCGVDIIRDQAGRLYVLEVNSIPAWRGLQDVTGKNIAEALVEDFLAGLEGKSAQTLTAV